MMILILIHLQKFSHNITSVLRYPIQFYSAESPIDVKNITSMMTLICLFILTLELYEFLHFSLSV